jgi:hypothetical protein
MLVYVITNLVNIWLVILSVKKSSEHIQVLSSFVTLIYSEDII